MQMRIRRIKHCKQMMDQHRMWRTEGTVLESMKIRHGDDVDVDEEEEASQANDGSMQNLED